MFSPHKTMLILLMFIGTCFGSSEFETFMIEVRDLMLEIQQNGSENGIQKLRNLTDESNLSITLCKPKTDNFDEFLDFLKWQRTLYEIYDTKYEDKERWFSTEFEVSLFMRSVMNFKTKQVFRFQIKDLKIVSIEVDGCVENGHVWVEDEWPDQNYSAFEYAFFIDGLLPFHEVLHNQKLRSKLFTHEFSAEIDEDFTSYNRDGLLNYMRIFNNIYEFQNFTKVFFWFEVNRFSWLTKNPIKVITAQADHLVFTTRMTFRLRNSSEENTTTWDFQFEAFTKNHQWRIDKMIMKPSIEEIIHPKRNHRELFTTESKRQDKICQNQTALRTMETFVAQLTKITNGNQTQIDKNHLSHLKIVTNCGVPQKWYTLKFLHHKDDLPTISEKIVKCGRKLEFQTELDYNYHNKSITIGFIALYNEFNEDYEIHKIHIGCVKDHIVS